LAALARADITSILAANSTILLHMQINPVEEWQRLTEHYRTVYDEELKQLAAQFDDLTETAKQVLLNELKNRGLPAPGSRPISPDTSKPFSESRFRSAVDPEAGVSREREFDAAEEDEPKEFTWKTLLCECETTDQALALCEMLKRAKIESWYEPQNNRMGVWGPRVTVAADQLEDAINVASQPVPQDILDELRVEVPEYETPRCPGCGAEDPVLESVEPANSWLCEACGKQWTDPVPDTQPAPENQPVRRP
jgi:hypothetical protein